MKYIWSICIGAIALLSVSAGNLMAEVEPLNQVPDKVGFLLQKQMIWVSRDAKPGSSFVAFRRGFTLPAAAAGATVHLFADVRYLLWINGKYVLRGPARFDPKGPEYDTDDVNQYLHKGENELVVLVMADQSNGKMMHHVPGFTLQLEVTGADASRTTVSTDEHWKWSDRTRYRNPHVDWGNEMDVIDSTVESGDWTQPDFDDSNWAHAARINGSQWGQLSARRIPLLKDTPIDVKLNGKSLPLTISAGQRVSFSTDHLVQAYTVIDFDADADTRFDLSYAGISYEARAGPQQFISTDTHGFYGGTIKVRSGKMTIYSFTPVELIYPFECIGSFTCNDPFLNKLWKMCARSVQVMSEDSYVDCADRERTEWMDDTPPCYDITRTAMAGPGEHGNRNFGDPRLLEELLRRTALTLQPDGWVKAHTCSDRFDIHAKMEDRSCDWVEGARLYYQDTGDAAAIREIWPAIVSQMNYFLLRRSPRGLVIGREWVIWDNPMGYENGEGTGLNAWVCKALIDAAFLGKEIGKLEDAGRFDRGAKDLSSAINNVLWDEKDGTYYSGYDTPQAEMPAGILKGKIGLQPDWHLRPKPPTLADNRIAPTVFSALFALDQQIVPVARQKLVTDYLVSQPDPDTRIMFYYYYWKQLYALHRPDLDESILQAMRNKWRTMTNSPWQTSWEDFQVGSQAHCYGMFPGYFLSAYVLGVRPGGLAAEKHVLIEPRLGDLTNAQGTVVTPSGPVFVSWEKNANTLKFAIKVPDHATASLFLPAYKGAATLLLDEHAVTLSKSDHSTYRIEVHSGKHTGVLTFPTEARAE